MQSAAGSGDRDREEREDGDAEGRLTQGHQEEVAEEPEQDVGRVARGVGRAHDRQHGLELAGVPETHAGHEPSPGIEDDDGGNADRRSEKGQSHHPSTLPQITPHRLMSTDAAISPTPSHPTRPRRDIPTATSGSANTTKSLLNR